MKFKKRRVNGDIWIIENIVVIIGFIALNVSRVTLTMID